MKTIRIVVFAITGLVLLLYGTNRLEAQNTVFTYQGRLNIGTNPANGSYDLTFGLFSTVTGAGQVGTTQTNVAVAVSNGLFTVALDFGNQFPGANRWLEIGVRTNTVGAFTTLAPRQLLTAAPYAVTAANLTGTLPMAQLTGALPSAQLAGAYSGAVTLSNAANSFTGNGTGLTNVNAASLNGVTASNFWRLDGNNVAPNQFLGSTNNQPLEFKVNGARAWRLEPNATGPNVVGGYSGNIVSNGFVGAVIAGGGQLNNSNRVGGSFSTVGGGYNNVAYFGSATVPGGSLNEAAAAYAFAAGRRAKATNQGAFVWADSQNADFASTANNQFLIRAAGGVGIGTTNPGAALDVAGTARATAFVGNGAGLTNVNALTFGGFTGNDFWRTTGNAGITGGVNFLGTSDNQPLEVRVNGQRILWFEASPFGPPNIVGGLGSQGSAASLAGWGNTIGGGATNMIADNFNGRVYNTIGGGFQNHIRESAFSTIAGGDSNTIASASVGVIGGGSANAVRDNYGIIGGGSANAVWEQYGIIAGGESNFVYSYSSSIGGGSGNIIDGYADFARIGGGLNNQIGFDARSATIGGGYYNRIGESAYRTTIGGGDANTIHSNASYATIGGGFENRILDSAFHSSIAGGAGNQILTNGVFATIPGGYFNTATNFAFAAGRSAKAVHSGAFVWGDSTDADVSSTAPNQFLVRASGGVGINTVSPGSSLEVNGGIRARGGAPGGFGNNNNGYAFSGNGGDNDSGLFSSADGQLELFINATERLRIISNGNVGIGTATPVSALQVVGTVTATAFNPPSDRNLKENFTPVNPCEVLEKVVALPISRWNFRGDAATPHVGPMAQDFHAAFRLGTDERHIATVDADGVALAAIQGLNQKLEEQRAENTALKRELDKLKQILDKLVSAKN